MHREVAAAFANVKSPRIGRVDGHRDHGPLRIESTVD
jgi:hypothetical protein